MRARIYDTLVKYSVKAYDRNMWRLSVWLDSAAMRLTGMDL